MKTLLNYFIIIVGLLIVNSCANIVQPIGGKKDVEPPKVLKSSPENSSLNFTEKEILISFDEFIQLKNINQEFFISPPVAKMPDIKVKGKKLQIKFSENLAENTTYTLGFGNAITDITEGNPYKGFSFRFSTGNTLDSLSIVGNVKNASTFLPLEKVVVMLHSNLNDSAPIKNIPDFIANSNKQGDYNIQNIRPGKYKIYALSDINNNLKYDLPNELFAFKDSILDIKYPETIDTTKNYLAKINLNLFEKESKNIFIKDKKRDSKPLCVATFNKAMKEKPLFSLLNNKSKLIIDYNTTLDTIKIWLADTNLVSKDTVKMITKYQGFENEIPTLKTDTIQFIYVKNAKLKTDFKFLISSNISTQTSTSVNNAFNIFANEPIKNIDTSKIVFTQTIKDKSKRIKYEIVKNPANSTQYTIQYKADVDKNYSFFAKSGAFKSIYDELSDSIKIEYKVIDTKNLGSLFVTLSNINQNTIIQLISESGKIIRENKISKSQKIEFLNLQQEKYSLKAIFDDNNDGKWTTGEYSTKQQPEKTLKYSKEITIKPNWDFEIEWDLKK